MGIAWRNSEFSREKALLFLNLTTFPSTDLSNDGELFYPTQFPNGIFFKCSFEWARNASQKSERLPIKLIEELIGPALLETDTDKHLSEGAISLSSASDLAAAI